MLTETGTHTGKTRQDSSRNSESVLFQTGRTSSESAVSLHLCELQTAVCPAAAAPQIPITHSYPCICCQEEEDCVSQKIYGRLNKKIHLLCFSPSEGADNEFWASVVVRLYKAAVTLHIEPGVLMTQSVTFCLSDNGFNIYLIGDSERKGGVMWMTEAQKRHLTVTGKIHFFCEKCRCFCVSPASVLSGGKDYQHLHFP